MLIPPDGGAPPPIGPVGGPPCDSSFFVKSRGRQGREQKFAGEDKGHTLSGRWEMGCKRGGGGVACKQQPLRPDAAAGPPTGRLRVMLQAFLAVDSPPRFRYATL